MLTFPASTKSAQAHFSISARIHSAHSAPSTSPSASSPPVPIPSPNAPAPIAAPIFPASAFPSILLLSMSFSSSALTITVTLFKAAPLSGCHLRTLSAVWRGVLQDLSRPRLNAPLVTAGLTVPRAGRPWGPGSRQTVDFLFALSCKISVVETFGTFLYTLSLASQIGFFT